MFDLKFSGEDYWRKGGKSCLKVQDCEIGVLQKRTGVMGPS